MNLIEIKNIMLFQETISNSNNSELVNHFITNRSLYNKDLKRKDFDNFNFFKWLTGTRVDSVVATYLHKDEVKNNIPIALQRVTNTIANSLILNLLLPDGENKTNIKTILKETDKTVKTLTEKYEKDVILNKVYENLCPKSNIQAFKVDKKTLVITTALEEKQDILNFLTIQELINKHSFDHVLKQEDYKKTTKKLKDKKELEKIFPNIESLKNFITTKLIESLLLKKETKEIKKEFDQSLELILTYLKEVKIKQNTKRLLDKIIKEQKEKGVFELINQEENKQQDITQHKKVILRLEKEIKEIQKKVMLYDAEESTRYQEVFEEINRYEAAEITNINTRDHTISCVIVKPILFYNKTSLKLKIKNSNLTPRGELISIIQDLKQIEFEEAEKLSLKILEKLFLSQRYKINTYVNYDIALPKIGREEPSVDSRSIVMPEKISDLFKAIPHPHIQSYHCFQTAKVEFKTLLAKGQYKTAIKLIFASLSNWNPADSAVTNKLFEELYYSVDNKDFRQCIIDQETGKIISIKDLIDEEFKNEKNKS